MEKYLVESMSLDLWFPSGTEKDYTSFKSSGPRGSDNIESDSFRQGYEIISNSPQALDSSMVGEVASNMRNMSMTKSEGQLESLLVASRESEEKSNYNNIDEGEYQQDEEDYDDNDVYFDDSYSEGSDY